MSFFESKHSPEFTDLDDHERLLEIDESSYGNFDVASTKAIEPFSLLKSWRLILAFICATYIVVSAPLLIILSHRSIPLLPYSPVNEVLSYERHPLYFGEDPKFTGAPEDVDEAWDYLLEPINIHTSREELEMAHATFGQDIVRLTNGEYVSVLSVHHELHCLNALRMNIFHDYYFPNATVEEEDYNISHMTHCVDTIRRSLMCKADVSLYTAYWIGDHNALPNKELRSESETVCVNWEPINAWSRERLLPRNKYKTRPGPFETDPLGA
ncbi:uncharacterized protein EAE97_002843 [Botrytis byssoidea]|uniref:Tat pathway signal sequence n=1 Tax=Botrytis byssoidea TaxID=139641 RepID=A0A9P5IVM5_9HELO|nr:uncharacterized protein EAE97_002843 [Botrytis byssoidea]KAF7949334.1 hypothetical protein EAE97_002843 [Botrytis byssoidea]